DDRTTDPFSTGDPLKPGVREPGDEGELDCDFTDDDVDPADDIYVNSEYPILKYRMESFSTLNDQDTDEQVKVKDKGDKWFVNWTLRKSTSSPESIEQQYRRLRLRQATYFERAAPDTPDEDLSPMVKILRRISRRNMWRNEPPKGKVVVNHSRLPAHSPTHSRPPAHSAAHGRLPAHSTKKRRPAGKHPGKPAGKHTGEPADKEASASGKDGRDDNKSKNGGRQAPMVSIADPHPPASYKNR
ncbi:hypothetical protein LPJ61_001528, partial [Coemansia biformis]